MLRTIIPTVALLLALPMGAQAASLADFNLNKNLLRVAEKSNEGKPRAISPDLLDKGFTVDGTVLINNLEASPILAAQMRSAVRTQRLQRPKLSQVAEPRRHYALRHQRI